MRDRRLIVCLLVALTARLAFIFLGFPYLQQRWHLREDGDGYGLIAQSIREHHYDDVTRGPVYPMFLAALGSPVTVKVFQAFLDTLTCLLIYLLANRNLWGAWLWALYPFAIWRVAFINKEVMLASLLVTYACLQLHALRQDKAAPWAWAGLYLGLVNLCKPMFLPWPLMIAALAWLNRKSLAHVAVLALAMLTVIVPWTARNWRVTGGDLVPVATEQGGMTTFVGNYQPTAGLWEGPGKIRWMAAVDEIKVQHPEASIAQMDRICYRAALQEVAANPIKAAVLDVRKCVRFWFLSAKRREQAAGVAVQGIYLALAAIGLWRLRPWNGGVVMMVTLVGYVMLLHALSYADLRFSLPVMPLVCVFACYSLCRTEASRSAA